MIICNLLCKVTYLLPQKQRYLYISHSILPAIREQARTVVYIPIPVWILEAEDSMTSPRAAQMSLVKLLISEPDNNKLQTFRIYLKSLTQFIGMDKTDQKPPVQATLQTCTLSQK